MSEEQTETKGQKAKRFFKELYNGYFNEFQTIHSFWGKVGWAFSPIWLPIAVIAVVGGFFTYQVILKKHMFRKGTLVEDIENPNDLFIVIKLIGDLDDKHGFMCTAYSVERMAEYSVPLMRLKKAKV